MLARMKLAGCATALEPLELECATTIDSVDEPPEGYRTVLDVAALDGTELEVNEVGSGDDRYYAKTGLLVRAGQSFVLEVPEAQRGAMSIDWGSLEERTWERSVPACDSDASWLVFAGGYRVREPGCLPLRVRQGEREEEVEIGVGAPCGARGR
jgi:hypothetical protein